MSRYTPTHARKNRLGLIIAIGAAVVVLGGGGTAVAANTIGSSDIVNQTIKSWDIAKNGVGKSEVRSGAVGASEVREGVVDHSELVDGGVNEEDLAQGVRDKLATETQKKSSDPVSVAVGATASATVNCSDDTMLLGGGYDASGLDVNSSEPVDNKNKGWKVTATNSDGVAHDLVTHAVCTK